MSSRLHETVGRVYVRMYIESTSVEVGRVCDVHAAAMKSEVAGDEKGVCLLASSGKDLVTSSFF